jgi:hypothetical protein
MVDTAGDRLRMLIEPVQRQLILSGYHDLATRLQVSLELACEPEHLIDCLTLTLKDIHDMYAGTSLNVLTDVRKAQDFIETDTNLMETVRLAGGTAIALPNDGIDDLDSANNVIREILKCLDSSGNYELELGLYQAWRFTFSSGEFYGELKDELTKIVDANLRESVGIAAATSSVLSFVTQMLDTRNGKL